MIKNLTETADRIKEAIEKREKIVLYSDADMDGTGSAVILKETIEALGGEILYIYFPDRGGEGYGLNDKALRFIRTMTDDRILLITMDCGIANFDEAITAKQLDMELIIIDHHQPHNRLPEASIIVDPKQEGDNYPFKDFANAGLIYRLAQEILGDLFEEYRKSFSEIAALSTIADMMRPEEDNKEIIDEGLSNLTTTSRPGLKVFWTDKIVDDQVSIRETAQRITSIFGASEITDHKTEAYLALVAKDEKDAGKIIKRLFKKNRLKQETVLKMVEQVMKTVSSDDKVIFKGRKCWQVHLLGSAASRIVNELKVPIFLYKKGEKSSRGAVRAPQGVNAVDVMSQSSDILLEYGGHPPAAGFKIDNNHLKEFEKRLKDYFNR